MSQLLWQNLSTVLVGMCAFGAKRPSHRIVGWLYAAVIGVSLGRHLVDRELTSVQLPYAGRALVLYYADHALYASVAFANLAAWVRHFSGRSLRPVLIGYLGTAAGIVVYKEATGASLVPVQLGIEVATSLVGAFVVGRALVAQGDYIFEPDGAHLILMFQLGASAVRIAMPYRGDVVETWADVRSMEITLNSVILTGYLVAFANQWRKRPTRRAPGG